MVKSVEIRFMFQNLAWDFLYGRHFWMLEFFDEQGILLLVAACGLTAGLGWFKELSELAGWCLLDFKAASLVEDFLGVLHREQVILLQVKEGSICLSKTLGLGTFTPKALAWHVWLGQHLHVVTSVMRVALDCVCGADTLLDIGAGRVEAASIECRFICTLQRLAFIH